MAKPLGSVARKALDRAKRISARSLQGEGNAGFSGSNGTTCSTCSGRSASSRTKGGSGAVPGGTPGSAGDPPQLRGDAHASRQGARGVPAVEKGGIEQAGQLRRRHGIAHRRGGGA